MSVRLFGWRDLRSLQRYRNSSVYLDSALVLTRGELMVPGALLSSIAPNMGVFTCVSDGYEDNDTCVLGQFIHTTGSPLSHLTFLTPGEALEGDAIGPLVEFMMAVSGERGALRLLADVDERTSAFEALRRSGFAIFTRQRIWQLASLNTPSDQISGEISETPGAYGWHTAIDRDMIAVRTLYNNLVPGLVQQYEPIAVQKSHGLVYYQDGELAAWVDLIVGHRGIWAQPLIHPDTENVQDYLLELLAKITKRRKTPVYICVRSYQAWLEPAIEALGAQVGPRQAVMARQLVVQQKAARTFALPALEGGQAEVTAPIARVENT